jgi:hypothetical protein
VRTDSAIRNEGRPLTVLREAYDEEIVMPRKRGRSGNEDNDGSTISRYNGDPRCSLESVSWLVKDGPTGWNGKKFIYVMLQIRYFYNHIKQSPNKCPLFKK